ncbi:TonB-dependent receptor domain-containing protein [Mucilaginibacter litoreus]|uniref:TonB-dependent receptor domain-containing protein n=1 Tax=Mucilaginibacter litoreus TaxID=1048221 RepID=A0ABW3ASY0_9SPHI
MKKILLFFLMILPGLAFSQLRLKGKVTDAAGHPLDAATITLTKDHKHIASAFADLGNFNVVYPANGIYILSATLVGYQPVQMQLQLPKDSILLVMQPDSKHLNEVTIAYRRPLIERKIDRVSFNVENSILASGSSAWEALIKTPGLQVNTSNDITANRKTVKIYLDGKPLQLSGDDLPAYLQGLPSDQVARIEVFSNPPAQFEAEGASVINIVTKKAKKQGFNVTLNGGFTQATYSGYNASTSFNYRKDKLNVYGSYGFAHRHNFQDHDTYIDFGNSLWGSPNRNIYQSDNHNYRVGLDYQLKDNQVLGLLVTGSNRKGNTEGHTLTRITNKQLVLDSTLQTDNFSENSGNQYTYNLNYNLKLDSGKRSLNIDADYSPYQTSSDAYADNLSFLPDGSRTPNMFHIYTPSRQHIDIYSGKIDYNYKLAGRWEVTSGLKYSSTQSYNDFDYYNRDGSTLTAIPQNSNHFTYNENTAAAYTSFSGVIGQWTLQAGLRGEYTRTRGYSVTLDSLNRRNYLKLFPTLFAQYKLSDDHELQLNYAYRIDRPEYNRLNPAKRYSSPYNIYVGNPALQPAFVHNIEFGYTYKQLYNVTAYYTATHDLFTNINIQDNQTKVYYGTHANLGLSVIAGLRISAPFHPTTWWEVNVVADAFRQHEKSAYLSGSYDYHLFSFAGVLNQAFTINSKNGLKAEINSVYNGPGLQAIYRSGHNSEIDAGIKTNIFGGKGTLRLAVNDIFNTNVDKVNINFQDQQSRFIHHVESRNATLSITWRLGRNVTASRSRTTASEEERKRAQ